MAKVLLTNENLKEISVQKAEKNMQKLSFRALCRQQDVLRKTKNN